jgi:hypothetical protein
MGELRNAYTILVGKCEARFEDRRDRGKTVTADFRETGYESKKRRLGLYPVAKLGIRNVGTLSLLLRNSLSGLGSSDALL